MRGFRGLAQLGELGLCIGCALKVGRPTEAWIEGTALLLSASEATRDFCISGHGDSWVLWRWYGIVPQWVSEKFIEECEAKLEGQLALAAYFVRRASVVRSSSRKPLFGARLA
ncbi:hypothetical protein [Burkholderia sp. Bp8986]|uniref:hypothetical protein n=1 Tax=Burkholderia sp. Bp8986 TaxID=2184550 RepID=UPI000F5B1FD6|nr:hypothetical protein [Burkholderia sp. Bp8986]